MAKSSSNNRVVTDEELNRAAQFLPFDALKGLSEELRKREERRSRVERVELSDEEAETVNAELCKLRTGDTAEISFYYKGHYLTIEGTVGKIVPQMKYLTMGTERINFSDIAHIVVK